MNAFEKLVRGAFVINLASRTDRWEAVQKELARVGYSNYERYNAFGMDNPPSAELAATIPGFKMSGWWGNKLSHLGAIAEAKRRGWSAVMIFEDDVIFHPRFDELSSGVVEDMGGMGKWDWLQLGGNHRFFGDFYQPFSPIDGLRYMYTRDSGLVQMSDRVSRIIKMLTAHAYIVRASVYDFILKYAVSSPLSIDGFYCYEVHNRFACYAAAPCMAKQAPGLNDIGGEHSDYTWYIGD